MVTTLVASQNSKQKLESYINAVHQATQVNGKSVLQYVIFSDSVIINSVHDDDESFISIVEACGTLFAQFLEYQIPLRGAIAHGHFLRSSKANGSFVAGAPIVEAFDYESRQNWAGIMLCPSTIARQANLNERCSVPLFHQIMPGFDLNKLRLPVLVCKCFAIPFHKEDKSSLDEPDTFEGYAVLPTGAGVSHSNAEERILIAIRALESLKFIAPDPKAQLKFKNAIRWLQLLQDQWRQIRAAVVHHGLS